MVNENCFVIGNVMIEKGKDIAFQDMIMCKRQKMFICEHILGHQHIRVQADTDSCGDTGRNSELLCRQKIIAFRSSDDRHVALLVSLRSLSNNYSSSLTFKLNV